METHLSALVGPILPAATLISGLLSWFSLLFFAGAFQPLPPTLLPRLESLYSLSLSLFTSPALSFSFLSQLHCLFQTTTWKRRRRKEKSTPNSARVFFDAHPTRVQARKNDEARVPDHGCDRAPCSAFENFAPMQRKLAPIIFIRSNWNAESKRKVTTFSRPFFLVPRF